MKITSILLCVCILTMSVQFTLGQTTTASTFKVQTLVSDGKKSKEENSTLKFSENSFSASMRKNNVLIKELNYADVVSADYSYSKKPLLSTGGAVAMAIFTGLLVVPFLFVKKKQHWISVRTANDYVVMRLDRENYRQVLNEFQIHKVEVKTLDEDANSKDKKKTTED